MNDRRELLIGCGSKRIKEMCKPDDPHWHNLTTLDFTVTHDPDITWDLNDYPWGGLKIPMRDDGIPLFAAPMVPQLTDNTFDEIHAYEVLEHLGRQGDFLSFFACFSEIYRLLKPGGLLFAHCPAADSPWAWGDPGHTRIIAPESLVFLDQAEYTAQVGKTAMSDYRDWWKGDFATRMSRVRDGSHYFVLEAIKPSRISV